MSFYLVRWNETWARQVTVDIDEECLRDWAGVPNGPISEGTLVTYLEQNDGYGNFHPGTMPTAYDDFVELGIESVAAPVTTEATP